MTESLIKFDQNQINLISRTIAAGATKDELLLFVGMCKRTGLDPFTRQIYFIKDKTGRVMTQVSVDGFRVIAERSGDYAGQDAPVFEEENGKIKKCTVTVYRWHGDTRYPAAVGVAYWDEYARASQTWQKLAHQMISKVAECIALRKAFPNDLSGLYAPEEMEQAGLSVAQPIDVQPNEKQVEVSKLMGKGKTALAKPQKATEEASEAQRQADEILGQDETPEGTKNKAEALAIGKTIE